VPSVPTAQTCCPACGELACVHLASVGPAHQQNAVAEDILRARQKRKGKRAACSPRRRAFECAARAEVDMRTPPVLQAMPYGKRVAVCTAAMAPLKRRQSR